jgi:hypothetical protein
MIVDLNIGRGKEALRQGYYPSPTNSAQHNLRPLMQIVYDSYPPLIQMVIVLRDGLALRDEKGEPITLQTFYKNLLTNHVFGNALYPGAPCGNILDRAASRDDQKYQRELDYGADGRVKIFAIPVKDVMASRSRFG